MKLLGYIRGVSAVLAFIYNTPSGLFLPCRLIDMIYVDGIFVPQCFANIMKSSVYCYYKNISV